MWVAGHGGVLPFVFGVLEVIDKNVTIYRAKQCLGFEGVSWISFRCGVWGSECRILAGVFRYSFKVKNLPKDRLESERANFSSTRPGRRKPQAFPAFAKTATRT